MQVIRSIKKILDMIKFQHTIFALPFALTATLIAANGLPDTRTIFWIIIAMIGARSGAMAFNRYADADIDALNPRTKNRHIPKGELTKGQVLLFSIASYALLIYAAYNLNPLCFYLSPVAIFITAFYSYTKRFTALSHIVLGVSLSLAPIGAWIAVKGTIETPAIVLGCAVMFWVAGFDILYALQDIDFDKKYGLFSIPRFLGVKRSIYLARLFHIMTVILLLSMHKFTQNLGIFYTAGVIIAAIMLIYEHSLVKPNDLSKLNIAFFNMNGYISVTIFTFTALNFLARYF